MWPMVIMSRYVKNQQKTLQQRGYTGNAHEVYVTVVCYFNVNIVKMSQVEIWCQISV